MTTTSDQRERTAVRWVYWGATGLLQPLSEEFLYRSPADSARRGCARTTQASFGSRHARR